MKSPVLQPVQDILDKASAVVKNMAQALEDHVSLIVRRCIPVLWELS